MEQYPRYRFGPFHLAGSRERRSSDWRLHIFGRKVLEMTTGWHHLALRWYPRSKMLQVYPGWGAWFFYWPWRDPNQEREFDEESYGISIHKDAFWWFGGGEHPKIMHWPWDWQHDRTSYLMSDGTWKHEWKRRGLKPKPNSALGSSHAYYHHESDPDLFRETHAYHYMLDNGQVQHVEATITVREMEWRMRKAMWFPWIRMVRRSIDVRFSDEVGERAGSWKGGTVGCGYDLRRFETPRQCLMRMQRERRFR